MSHIRSIEDTAHLLNGMCMDQRIPADAREVMRARAQKLYSIVEAATDDECGETSLHDMVRWAYSKLHHINYSKQSDSLMLDRMKLLLEHDIEG
jgi:hypothetical protein